MSVIVKGLSKPYKCQFCPFLRWYKESGNIWCNAKNQLMKQGLRSGSDIDISVPNDCPIVAIQENCDTCAHREELYDSGFCDSCAKEHTNWEPFGG